MSSDPILDLILQQDREIDEAIRQQSELDAQLSTARRTLTELVAQREALEQIAIRRGWDVPPAAGEVRTLESDDWVSMPRTSAVERILKESDGSMHLTEIQTALAAHGRGNDSLEVISASLAHLKKQRKSVASLGGGTGRWEYVRAGTSTGMGREAAERILAKVGMSTLDSAVEAGKMPQGWKESDETHQPY